MSSFDQLIRAVLSGQGGRSPASPPRAVHPGIALGFWFALGLVGGHRFYLGDTAYGLIMLFVNVSLTVLTGGEWLIAAFVWWVFELLLLPRAIESASP